MHSPFITREGARRVDCCNFNCRQARDCPARQACELPLDDFDPSKPNVLASAVKYDFLLIAFVLVVVAFIGAVPYLF